MNIVKGSTSKDRESKDSKDFVLRTRVAERLRDMDTRLPHKYAVKEGL